MLFTGDLFFWVAPNAGNPQKVQRYAAEWARALRAMAARKAEILIPGHGVPILGEARVRQTLDDTAEWLETLERETVTRMNAGLALDQILAEVRPPAHLADRPYLQAVYDEPEYVVRNIWRLYGGWWDGQPAHLKPAREAEIGSEIAALAGGAEALAERALAVAASGRHALACHLVDWAAASAPNSARVHTARAGIYEARARISDALMTRGIFDSTARDSATKAGSDPEQASGPAPGPAGPSPGPARPSPGPAGPSPGPGG
jgi:alkyl sulfatase BDS1-like metallo-beta-lactamase superfamily hydrolase